MVRISAALRDNGSGRVVGCQPDADRASSVAVALDQAGLSPYADVVRGEIRDVLRRLSGPVDLLVLGGPAERFSQDLRAIEPQLLPGAVVVACGDEDATEASADFLARVRGHGSGYVSLSLPLDAGLEMAVRVV